MTTVVHADLRVLGYCNCGSRHFFARHGLDWREFLHSGIDAAVLLGTGDAMAARAVEQAQKREAAQ